VRCEGPPGIALVSTATTCEHTINYSDGEVIVDAYQPSGRPYKRLLYIL